MTFAKLGAGSHYIRYLAILVETTPGNCSGELIQRSLKHLDSDGGTGS